MCLSNVLHKNLKSQSNKNGKIRIAHRAYKQRLLMEIQAHRCTRKLFCAHPVNGQLSVRPTCSPIWATAELHITAITP